MEQSLPTDAELAALPRRDGFRLRGLATTRLDTFVDAAFAFGATVLLISSGDLPRDYPALVALVQDIPAFALSFGTLMVFWLSHRLWSRMYGLENGWTIGLTLTLVVTVLVYVYPLKLMFGMLVEWLTGGVVGGTFAIENVRELRSIMLLYGIGFAVLSGCLLGLYVAAYRAADALRLDGAERAGTRVGLAIWGTLAGVALLATLGTALLPLPWALYSAFGYWLIPVLLPVVMRWARRQRRVVPTYSG